MTLLDNLPPLNPSTELKENQANMSENSPLKNDEQTNVSLVETICADNDFQGFLSELRQKNEEMMNTYDVRIKHIQVKINKMNYEVKKLINEKQHKQEEFVNLLNEYTRAWKTKKYVSFVSR